MRHFCYAILVWMLAIGVILGETRLSPRTDLAGPGLLGLADSPRDLRQPEERDQGAVAATNRCDQPLFHRSSPDRASSLARFDAPGLLGVPVAALCPQSADRQGRPAVLSQFSPPWRPPQIHLLM